MKNLILLLTILLSLNTFSQSTTGQSFVVRNPSNYPYGINIDGDYATGWCREFNFSYKSLGNLFSFGMVADNSKLRYGYIGGNNAESTVNYMAPWMTFMPNGNVGIGTINPRLIINYQYRLQL